MQKLDKRVVPYNLFYSIKSLNDKMAVPGKHSNNVLSSNLQGSTTTQDEEKQQVEDTIVPDKVSAFKGLGLLDRYLAVWILLAMIVGILLGNFVSNTGPALQKGKFVGVSVPIGEYYRLC